MKVKSKNCPMCGKNTEIEITDQQYQAIKNGELIQFAIENYPPEVRERFISGICPECWKNIFGDGEEDED